MIQEGAEPAEVDLRRRGVLLQSALKVKLLWIFRMRERGESRVPSGYDREAITFSQVMELEGTTLFRFCVFYIIN